MLIEFKVSNYKSFCDEQTFSMVASPDQSLRENTSPNHKIGKQRILRTAVVYGANAAGKSNLFDALNFISHFVRESAERKPGTRILVQSFLLNKELEVRPSTFELTFITNNVRYQYGFSVDTQKVWEEYLIAYPKNLPQTWFHRSISASGEYEWYFGSQLKGEKRKIEVLTRPETLFISVAATFNQTQLAVIYRWLSDNLRVIDLNSSSLYFENITAQHIQNKGNFRKLAANLLKIADLGIVDVTSEENDELPEDMPEELKGMILKGAMKWTGQYRVQLFHETDKEEQNPVPFDLTLESLGTRRFFALIGPWIAALRNGYTLVVDELDASLHPMLVKHLVRMFHDEKINTTDAQLIFNTHDTTLLDTSLLRRDQVWFVEKDKNGSSHIYSLLDYKPRKEESLAKGYLQGRYGAIPFLESYSESLFDRVKEESS